MFVSCWFFTKHDVTTSGCIFSKTDSMNTVMDPDYTGWLYCYRWQNTNLFIFRSFFPPLAHLGDATISSLRRKTTSSEQWLWHINLSSGLLTHTPQRKTSHSVSLSCSVSVCVCVCSQQKITRLSKESPVHIHQAGFRMFSVKLFQCARKWSLRLNREKDSSCLHESSVMILINWCLLSKGWMDLDRFVSCCFSLPRKTQVWTSANEDHVMWLKER